jgi:hypothetical protein
MQACGNAVNVGQLNIQGHFALSLAAQTVRSGGVISGKVTVAVKSPF